MYSIPQVPVDKGLGLNFSDFASNVASTGLNIYNQHMQLKIASQQAAAQQSMERMAARSAARQERPAFDTTWLWIGGAVVGGVVLFNMLRR